MAAVTVVTAAELPTESSSRSRPGLEQYPLRRDEKELADRDDSLICPKVQFLPQGYAAVLATGTGTGAQTESEQAGAGQSRVISFNTKIFQSVPQRQKSKLTYTNSGTRITEISYPFS